MARSPKIIPKPVQFNVRILKERKQFFLTWCLEHDRSATAVMNMIIDQMKEGIYDPIRFGRRRGRPKKDCQ